MQDRRPKQQHGHRDCGPAQNRRIEAEAAYFFPFPVLFLTEQPGNHGAAAQAENISQGYHQCKNRRAQGHSRYNAGILCPGDKKGVHHIIYQADHHAEYHRQRQLEICLGHRRPFK